jgi:putative transposase
VVVTDKLKSYDVALREDCLSSDHRSHKGLNNQAEASHWHTRSREKIMAQFKLPGHAQRFLSAHDQLVTISRAKRDRLSGRSYRHARADAFALWGGYAAELAA